MQANASKCKQMQANASKCKQMQAQRPALTYKNSHLSDDFVSLHLEVGDGLVLLRQRPVELVVPAQARVNVGVRLVQVLGLYEGLHVLQPRRHLHDPDVQRLCGKSCNLFSRHFLYMCSNG
jgi:hypothetical protein